ncbi:MAG: HAMP domain-containing protein [Proteobacteria bacterium]|nr:HAMP domain-containing protein [Pseudomonadota bacterium]
MSVTAAARRLVRALARIRTRLLLINVLVCAVPLVGITFAELHECQLLAALERDMIHQAALLRAMLVTDPPVTLGARGVMLAAAARDTRTRIRLLDAHGGVMSDSHRAGPPEGAERAVPTLLGELTASPTPTHAAEVPRLLDLGARPEVQRALAGHYGAATRLWEAQDRVYLFAALPILDADAHVEGVVYVTRSTRDVKLQLFQLRAWLVKFAIVTILGTALLSLLLAATIARPLARLTRRAQRIAARQPVDRDERDDLATRRDEIGQLARAVDAMTDELERRARDARTLAADLSHEFKTPLTGIRGAAELLRDGAADDPEARDRFLAMITDDADRLARLVSRLLELARLDEDRGTALPVDLAALAHACAARAWPCPIDVTGAGRVHGRAVAIAAAIDNHVANATQHADPATRVHILVDGPRVTVENHGPSLSPAAIARVWDRFYSTRAHAGGSGLGLAIVRAVALAHGGAHGVTCVDGVTRFWFTCG